MHSLNMIVQLVLPRERSGSYRFTPWAALEVTPEDCWGRGVSSIIVTFEVEPTAEGLIEACRVFTSEHVYVGVVGAIHGADACWYYFVHVCRCIQIKVVCGVDWQLGGVRGPQR